MDTLQLPSQPASITPRSAQALARAAAVTTALREIEHLKTRRPTKSYLAPGIAEDWAVMLMSDSPERANCNRLFQGALRTCVRYQQEVLRHEDATEREKLGDDAEVLRCIGSNAPFQTLASLFEIAGQLAPEYAAWILAATCTVAEWPIVNALNRTLPASIPSVLVSVANCSAYPGFTRRAKAWLVDVFHKEG